MVTNRNINRTRSYIGRECKDKMRRGGKRSTTGDQKKQPNDIRRTNIRRSPRSKASSVLPDTSVLSGNRPNNDCVRKTRKSAASKLTLSGKRTKSVAERNRTSNSEDSATKTRRRNKKSDITVREKKRITKRNSNTISVTKRRSNRLLALNEAAHERVHGRTYGRRLRKMGVGEQSKLAEEKEIRRRMMRRGRGREAMSGDGGSPSSCITKVCSFSINLNEPGVIRETQTDGDVINIYASRSVIIKLMNGDVTIF